MSCFEHIPLRGVKVFWFVTGTNELAHWLWYTEPKAINQDAMMVETDAYQFLPFIEAI